jgi:hypothetical protein
VPGSGGGGGGGGGIGFVTEGARERGSEGAREGRRERGAGLSHAKLLELASQAVADLCDSDGFLCDDVEVVAGEEGSPETEHEEEPATDRVEDQVAVAKERDRVSEREELLRAVHICNTHIYIVYM